MVVYDLDAIYGGVYLKGGIRNYTDWSSDFVVDWFERQKMELDLDARREINKEAELWLHSFEDNHGSPSSWVGCSGWFTATSRASTLLKPCSTSSSTKTCGWTANRSLQNNRVNS